MSARRRLAVGLALLTLLAACTSGGVTSATDPGKVVPAKHFSIPGRLYATKGRALYRFSGLSVKAMLGRSRVKDPAVTPDGARLAFALLQGQSSTIAVAGSDGQGVQQITPATAAEGSLWAFAPTFSTDGQRIAYLTDRGKRASSPKNLEPNDLGVWQYPISSGQSESLVLPTALTGGDSDPTFRPGRIDQLVYTTYLYNGSPLQTVARLTWMSTQTGRTVFLSPSPGRNLQPAFSPDGQFLAFIRGGVSSDDLWVTAVAASYGAEPHPFPADAATMVQSGIVAQPVWAPDGSALAFMMLVNGSFDLYLLPISTQGTIRATGPAVPITRGSFFDADSRLAWSP